MYNDLVTIEVTIAGGQSLSAPVDLEAYAPMAVSMPAAWTAANLTFQVSYFGDDPSATYMNLYDDAGTEYAVTAAASRYIILDPSELAGVRYLRVRSGTAATPVAQAADRRLVFVCREL